MFMATSQPALASASGGKLISGSPAFGGIIQSWMDNFQNVYSSAVSDALEALRKDLHQSTQAIPAWSEVDQFLDVEFDGESFSYVVTDADALSTVYSLEYGDGAGSAPSGFLRKKAVAAGILAPKLISPRLAVGNGA